MNISHVLWPEGGVCDAAYVAAYQQLQLITLTHLLTESCLTPIQYPPISIVGPGSSSIAAAKHGVGNKILAEAKATLGNLWP